MPSKFRQGVAPAYLFLCLILGGSAQGIWANMVLQLLGLATLAWAAVTPRTEPLIVPAKQFLLLAMAGLAIVLIQLVPLPPSMWSHLAGRQPIVAGYQALGIGVPALPLSLTPYKSLDSLLSAIPPLALFCAIARVGAYRTSWLASALIAGTVAGILLGALQVASRGEYASSPWYLYGESNFGVAVGFFANANHMADLLVVSLPFVAALAVSGTSSNRQRNSAIVVGACAVTIVILAGIAINRSLAAYGLAAPVMLASAVLVLPQKSGLRSWALLAAGLLVAAVVAAIAVDVTASGQFGTEAATSVTSRQEMLATTTRAARDFMPWGTGLGSFREVYHLYESRSGITPTYVVHAHNDYAELALELGLAGVLLFMVFLAWWGRGACMAWRHPNAGVFARAASIASATVLIHSFVDFPLRTAAISAVFAMCLALMIERRSPAPPTQSDLWPTRHVVLK